MIPILYLKISSYYILECHETLPLYTKHLPQKNFKNYCLLENKSETSSLIQFQIYLLTFET